jgi:hypothetical protein
MAHLRWTLLCSRVQYESRRAVRNSSCGRGFPQQTWRVIAVSPERVPARKEILAEGAPPWALTGPWRFEVFPRPELSVRAELALDLANRHCQVGLRIRLESFRDLEAPFFCPSIPLSAAPASLLLRLAGVVVRCFLFHNPLDPK